MTTELIMAVMTGSTCGFACWQARQEVCRCSCYGKNHGIMEKGGDQPRRQSKIDGRFFCLAAIGNERTRGHEQMIREFGESEHGAPFARKPYPSAGYERIPGNSKWDRPCLWWTKPPASHR